MSETVERASGLLPGVVPGRFAPVLSGRHELRLELLDGVGPKLAKKLTERGIADQLDLLMLLPRKYQRIHHFASGPDLVRHQAPNVEMIALILQVRLPQPRTRQPVEVTLDCDGQFFKVLWFNMEKASFVKQLAPGLYMHLRGIVDYTRHIPQIMHPEFRILKDEPSPWPEEKLSIEAVYGSMEGVPDKTLRKAVVQVCTRLLPHLGDILPAHIMLRHDLPAVAQALSVIHLLREWDDPQLFQRELKRARNRLVYEEFYTLQRHLAEEALDKQQKGRAPCCDKRELGRSLVRQLPFKLTGDQRRAIGRIAQDMQRPCSMRRLLQGDVGAGKTIVAFMAAALAIESKQQVAMMAPTDILARQHMRRAEEFFRGLGVKIAFLGGSITAAERRATLALAARGDVDLLLGTHALFQEDVAFRELGLVIIDEQHKFGVEQRDLLLGKGVDPHLLAMTATPIPRSLAHAVFGDLDLTIIREKPPGRQPIKTVLRDRSVAAKAYDYILERIKKSGEQAYFVYPMVEASEVVQNRQNVVEAAEALAKGVFSELRLGMLHGRLSADDKDAIMARFARHELDVLCATTVIEVGVDVANATMMVIESPEVFGLSQLHQLRGRVGRGDAASLCVLLAGEGVTEEGNERLTSFSKTDDGFELAEADLRIRGPGLFLGLRQAGHAEFRFGDLARDGALLEQARRDAREDVGLVSPGEDEEFE
jgi:ATP-dependent DNA helicase RecG